MNEYQHITETWKKNKVVTFLDKRWLVIRKGKKNSTLFCLDNLGEYDHEQADWVADNYGNELIGIIYPKEKPDKIGSPRRGNPKFKGLSFISRIPSVNDLTGRLYPALVDEVSENLVTGADYWLANYCGYREDNEYHFVSNKGKRCYCKGYEKKTVSPLLIVSDKEYQ